jgi:hypothetical protein
MGDFYSFTHIEAGLECLSNRERREQLLQYNLDSSLIIQKFRFSGNFFRNSASDYDKLIKDFFNRSELTSLLKIDGIANSPENYDSKQISTNVMSMEFFDKLNEFGKIKYNLNIKLF